MRMDNDIKINRIIKERTRTIASIINRGIVTIMIAFLLVSTGSSYVINTFMASAEAKDMLLDALYDLDGAATAYLNESMTNLLLRMVESGGKVTDKSIYEIDESDIRDLNRDNIIDTTDINGFLRAIMDEYDQKEISLISPDGIIEYSSDDSFVGYNIMEGDDSKLKDLYDYTIVNGVYLLNDIVISPDSNSYTQYAGIVLDRDCYLGKKGSIVRIGFKPDNTNEYKLRYSTIFAQHTGIGSTGGYLILKKTKDNEKENTYTVVMESVSEQEQGALNEEKEGEQILFPSDQYYPYQMFTFPLESEEYYCMYESRNGYLVAAVITRKEVLNNRNSKIVSSLFNTLVIFTLIGYAFFKLLNKHMTVPLRQVNRNLEEICEGNLDIRLKTADSKEFSMLSDDINIMVLTLKRYIRQAAERIDKELAIARAIQTSAVPNIFPPFPDRKEFEIYADMNTAKEVGGDFYDFFFIDNDHLAIVMADVSDKGIPAAMFMMTSKATIINRALQGGTPADILADVNNILCAGNSEKLFVTVWLGIIELSTGAMIEANAGHEHPAICRDGVYRFVKYPHSPPLALMENIFYSDRSSDIYPGEKLFLYTDGATDARNQNGESFGEEGLINALNNASALDTQGTVSLVKSAIDDFEGETVQFDDVTMCSFIYYGNKEGDDALQ